MAGHNKYDLLDQVVQAINESGWNVLYTASEDEHPFHLQVYKENESYKIAVYIWHLTHGGGPARPRNEYRIQITGVKQFQIFPNEQTLILGYWQEAEVFAGFDVRKHRGLLGHSPSIQIREEFLRSAYVSGFSPCDKGNNEVAIAFRPDFFVEYLRNLESLHDFGQAPDALRALEDVSLNPEINDAAIQIPDVGRREIIVSVSRKLRDVSFRRRVLTAYTYKCAVCGVQLGLVEAAHIIPVNHENSSDETRNGLALCALHHKAYDQALITISEGYAVILNENQVRELRDRKLDSGLAKFEKNLRHLIILPPAVTDRPHVEYIRLGNSIRGWKKPAKMPSD